MTNFIGRAAVSMGPATMRVTMTTSLLIVDDSTFSRNMIRRALPVDWDVNISEASNGHEALDKCGVTQFDAIFLDLTMPDMDGLDVLLELQNRDYKSKILIISADIQQSSMAISKERGAIDFLAKPISQEKLAAMLQLHKVL